MKFRLVLQTIFSLLRLGIDIVCIFGAFILAYYAKFRTGHYPVDYTAAKIDHYIAVLPYVILLWLLAFILVGLYRTPKGLLARLNEATLVLAGVTFGTLEVMAFSFAYPDFPTSRYVLGYTYIFATVFLTIARWPIHSLELWFSKFGIGNFYAAILGVGPFAQTIGEKMLLYPTLGYHLLGFIGDKKPSKINYHLIGKFKFLGKIKDIEKILKKNHIEVLFIAKQNLTKEQTLFIHSFCERNKIQLKTVPSLFELMATSIDVNALDGIPLLSFKKTYFSISKKIFKRIMDIIISLIAIILTSPLMLSAILIIKIFSPGPIIYKQERVGENGKVFDFLKFRTMPVGIEEKTGPILATSDQKQRTFNFGNILRKTSIDELPQLFNVFKGEMSLVGPRPERPYFVKRYLKEIPNYNERHLIKGGMTGWAQINGRAYLTAKPDEKLKYDIYYIENWSPLFDIKILLRTIGDVIFQRNVC
ncbi:MAG: sugar transferase [Candidatus Margulisbacteria bacterium]|nr:sugar transferase [Candidatus Margulisiibacteriota bacterium]